MALAIIPAAPAVQPPFVVTVALCTDCAERAAADNRSIAAFPARTPVARIGWPTAPDDEPTWEDAEWC